MTTNREVFAVDPLSNEIPNNGVATVSDLRTVEEWRTLRHELATFVCEGEYARGLFRILDTYLKNIDDPEQPAVWVSGFYGSGKSHLVKMLRYLWTDVTFEDGTSARGLVNLPAEIKDALTELSTVARRKGGLHAGAGTIGAGAGNLRLTLLSIIFRSAGLPEEYNLARFVLWLRANGHLDAVRAAVESAGKSFDRELRNMFMSPLLATALLAAHPALASSEAEMRSLLKAQYPDVKEISITQMLNAIAETLAVDGQLPCTLLVLDEVQQFIGDDSTRSYDVQEVTEACSKTFAGRLLFVATGQSALYGTPQLQRLKDRYTVMVELSDTDVETVTRKIVLAKAPAQLPALERALDACSGEIWKHLSDTRIRPTLEDRAVLAADYPILPVRRRFWERVLRAVDRAGTEGQLRNQLRITFEAVRAVAARPLGAVVPADFIYDQLASSMTNTGILLPEVDRVIRTHRYDGSADGALRARLCAAIFLIGRLPPEIGAESGIRATPDILADLLVEDLQAGSAALRQRIPALLDGLVERGELMQVEDDYRIQTAEGAAWDSDFRDRYLKNVNDDTRVAGDRADLLRVAAGERLKDVKLMQGASKTVRKTELFFGSAAPKPTGGAIPLWVRDGWSDDEKTVRADAQEAGTDSPMIFVFLPRRAADDLKRALAGQKAAEDVLAARGYPASQEGQEARHAVETRLREYRGAVAAAVEDIFHGARVWQGGGTEVAAAPRREAVHEAAQRSLARLYPQFDGGDSAHWSKVIERAKKGDGAPLAALGYSGETEKHPVCAQVLTFIGAGKKGSEARRRFADSPFGWPQDAVDGALLALVVGGCAMAAHNGAPLDARSLDGTRIGVADFRAEVVVISPVERLQVKKLLQDNGFSSKPNDELNVIPAYLQKMLTLAAAAGGAAPLPPAPDSAYISELQYEGGNTLLRRLYDLRERLSADARTWTAAAEQARQRLPRWQALLRLLVQARGVQAGQSVQQQADAILANHALLLDPDPVPALCATLTEALRAALTAAGAGYTREYEARLAALAATEPWTRLDDARRATLLADNGLRPASPLQVATEEDVLAALEAAPLPEWRSRTDALTRRFADATIAAAKLVEPQAVAYRAPAATLKTPADVKAWLAGVEQELMTHVEAGNPVVVQ